MVHNSLLHSPSSAASAEHIYKYYAHAQINYTDHFIRLYSAYNAWYRSITHTTNDREALTKLKKRFVIWDEYLRGRTLCSLKVSVEKIVQFTARNPLLPSMYWSGSLESTRDWKGLIEYWYQVRCAVVHGVVIPTKHIQLAYETLRSFMREIIGRMKRCFTQADVKRLKEIRYLANTSYAETSQFKTEKHALHLKYITSPDIWNVDMQTMNST